MMRYVIVAALWLSALHTTTNAQLQNSNWTFNRHSGIRFDSAGVHWFRSAGDEVHGANVTMSDRRSGELLFYFNGFVLYDRTHQPMPGGLDLMWTTGDNQALIVPFPNNPDLYYLFIYGDSLHGAYGMSGNRYSIVDMRLRDGLGDVTLKNVPLDPDAANSLIAMRHANGFDTWVIVRSFRGNTFRAYLITNEGISHTPVISTAGISDSSLIDNHIPARGSLYAAPNGRLFAQDLYFHDGKPRDALQIFGFDPSSGRVTYSHEVERHRSANSDVLCFSPNSRILYRIERPDPNTYDFSQILLDTLNADTLGFRKHWLRYYRHEDDNPGGIELGIDGRIYLSYLNEPGTKIGAILNPNAPGDACNFVDSVLGWTDTTGDAYFRSYGGVFQNIITDGSLDSVRGIFDFRAEPSQCFLPCYQLSLSGVIPAETSDLYTYRWDFSNAGLPSQSGTTASICLPGPGDHTISLIREDASGRKDTMTRVLRAPSVRGPVQVQSTTVTTSIGSSFTVPITVFLPVAIDTSDFDITRIELRLEFDTAVLEIVKQFNSPVLIGYVCEDVRIDGGRATLVIHDVEDSHRRVGPAVSFGDLVFRAKSNKSLSRVKVLSIIAHAGDSSYAHCPGEESDLAVVQIGTNRVDATRPKDRTLFVQGKSLRIAQPTTTVYEVIDVLGRIVQRGNLERQGDKYRINTDSEISVGFVRIGESVYKLP